MQMLLSLYLHLRYIVFISISDYVREVRVLRQSGAGFGFYGFLVWGVGDGEMVYRGGCGGDEWV